MKLFKPVPEQYRDPEAGWTFVETIIVIAIVLILTSSVGFMAFQYIGKAKSMTAKNEIENFSLAISTFYLDCGQYPSEDMGIDALWEKPSSLDSWDGPYLVKEPGDDPWGSPYIYTVPGPNGLPFSISSLGADGLEGGEGEKADVKSWEG